MPQYLFQFLGSAEAEPTSADFADDEQASVEAERLARNFAGKDEIGLTCVRVLDVAGELVGLVSLGRPADC